MEKGDQQGMTHRTCRVPLKIPNAKQWLELRRLAHSCAMFGNHLLTESYAKAQGVSGLHPYTDYNGLLSSAVRDAVNGDCVGIWRRTGKRILKGEQTLARFSADRALVVRGNGVILQRNDGGALEIKVRLHPKDIAPATLLPVWMPALARDRWLADIVDRLESSAYPLTKLTLSFERPGRKVIALVSYRKPISRCDPAQNEATLECSCEECRLRCGNYALSLNDAIHRLSAMKQHFGGIHSRLRRHLGRSGRRRTLRLALLKEGTFENWAQGPLHQLSREIVEWCQEHEVGLLRVKIASAGNLPWARPLGLIQYKADEAGVRMLSLWIL